jgi:hypothetical protein
VRVLLSGTPLDDSAESDEGEEIEHVDG